MMDLGLRTHITNFLKSGIREMLELREICRFTWPTLLSCFTLCHSGAAMCRASLTTVSSLLLLSSPSLAPGEALPPFGIIFPSPELIALASIVWAAQMTETHCQNVTNTIVAKHLFWGWGPRALPMLYVLLLPWEWLTSVSLQAVLKDWGTRHMLGSLWVCFSPASENFIGWVNHCALLCYSWRTFRIFAFFFVMNSDAVTIKVCVPRCPGKRVTVGVD